MQTKLQIQVAPETAASEALIKEEIRRELALDSGSILSAKILKRSIDARGRKIKINLTLLVAVGEQLPEEKISFFYHDVAESNRTCHIIGAGPAGLFAAL